MTIESKLFQIQSKLHTVDKSGNNTFNKYAYATLGDMLVPLRPHLAELELILVQSVYHTETSIKEMNNKWYSVAEVLVETRLIDIETGSVMVNQMPGMAVGANDDKAVFKAITGARKYGIAAMFSLEWFSIEPEDDRYEPGRDDRAQFNEVRNTTTKRGLGK